MDAEALKWIQGLDAKQKLESLAAAARWTSSAAISLRLTSVPQPEGSSSQPAAAQNPQKGQQQAKQQQAEKDASNGVEWGNDGSCKKVVVYGLGDGHRLDVDGGWRTQIVFQRDPQSLRIVFDAELEQQQQGGKSVLVLKVTGSCYAGDNRSTTGDAPAGQLRLQLHRVLAGILLWLYRPVRGLPVSPSM
jgi:hypothetical protein